MRPKSAISKRTPQHKKVQNNRYDSSILRTQYLHINSRITKNNLERSSISKMPSVRTVNNVKNIGLIHAYQPELLKNCLVKDKKSYTNFFSKKGDCKSPDIFLKSIITHFREWKKDINQRLSIIFDLILSTEYLKEEESQPKIKAILAQLKEFSTQLKQDLQQIVKTRIQSPQISQLLQKYEEVQWVIKRVILLVEHLFKFTKEVSFFLTQNRDINIEDTLKIANQLQVISKKHLKQIAEQMNYCHSLTENEMLLKLQYKIRQKMIQTNRNTLQIFQSIKTMKEFQKIFRTKLDSLQKCQVFDCEYIQNVVQFLYYKNQEIKVNQKKFDINAHIKENIYQLRNQIEARETNFICKFRNKCLNQAKITLVHLSQLKTLHLVKNRGKEYLQLKKKLLLIVKVFQQSEKQSGIDEQKYDKEKKIVRKYIITYSNGIKNISGLVQSLMDKIQSNTIFKEKSLLINARYLDKSIQEVAEIEKLQKQISKVTKVLYQQLCQAEGEVTTDIVQNDDVTDSQLLIKLNQLVSYSRNQQENNDVFHIIENNTAAKLQKSRKKQQTTNNRQQLFDFYYHSLTKSHEKFIKTGLEQGIIRNNQLKQLNKQELVQYLFENEFTNQFISNYSSIKNMVNIIDKLNSFVQKQYINHVEFCLLSCKTLEEYRLAVNQQIKNMQKSKYKSTFNKYIILLYENSLIRLLNLPYIVKLQNMRRESIDTSDYSKILQVFIQVYQTVLIKTKKDSNMFSEVCFQLYETAKNIQNENNFIKSYNQSFRTGVYYPSFQVFKELAELQYSVQIEETLSRESVRIRKEQIKSIFAYSTKKLEAVREKIKLKLLLNENHGIYADINQTLALLKTINFEQDFSGLLTKILVLLRTKQIKHSAVFSQDRNPVYLLPHLQSIHDANSLILTHLHTRTAPSANINLLIKMSYEDATDLSKYGKTENNQQSSVNESSGKPASIIKKLVDAKIVNDDEMSEEIVCEQSGIEIQSKIKQSMIQSAIQQVSNFYQKNCTPQKNSNIPNQNNQTYPTKSYCYYIIKSIQNIAVLKKCMFYRNNEKSFIKNKLQLALICNLDTPEERRKATTHIQQILRQLRESDLLRKMGVECEQPECENVLRTFEKAIKQQTNIQNSMEQLLEYFGFKRQLIFEKRDNKIELIYQDNNLPYFRMKLTQKIYKINVERIEVTKFLKFLWSETMMALQLNTKPQFTPIKEKSNSFVEQANKKLKTYYTEIQNELKQHLRIKHANYKQTESKIDSFLKNIVGIQSYLLKIDTQLTSFNQVVNVIAYLSTNVSKIKIFQPHHKLQYKQTILYFSGQEIKQAQIMICTMIDRQDPKLKLLPLSNNMVLMLSYDKVLQQMQKLLSRTPVSLQFVRELINQESQMQRQVNKAKQRMEKVNKLMNQIILLKILEPEIYKNMSTQINALQKEMEIYSFVQNLHLKKKIPHLLSLETNNNLKYNDKAYSVNKNKHLDHKQLTQLYRILKNNNIPCFQLYYRSKIIGLLNQLSIEEAAQLMNINLNSKHNIRQCFQIQKEKVIVNQLQLILANIVPKHNQTDTQAAQKICEYLKNTTLEIKVESDIERYSCYDCFVNQNKIEVQVDWNKSPIQLKLTNSQQQVKLIIQPNNFLFFMEVQPMSLQNHIKQKYQSIKQEVFQKQLQMEKNRQREKAQREEMLRQAEKKEAQRELEILQIQQTKLKIKLQNQQIQAKMRLMEEQKQRKEREEAIRREQQELRRRKQKEQQQARIKRQKQRKEQQQRKRQQFIQKLNDKTKNIQNEGSQLDISVVLSQGNSVRNLQQANLNFPGFSKLQEHPEQIEYELTLSENNLKSKTKHGLS